MYKFGEDPSGAKVLADFQAALDKGEVMHAMLAYVDNEGNMFMFGDSHSFTVIVGNMVMSALHKSLHEEEAKYEQRKETGGLDILQGFTPDDQAGS